MKIKTIDDAYEFVMREKVCTIFGSKGSPHPSLWDNVDLPGKEAVEKGWGEKVTAIWTWKNELPARFPDEIFYGKVKGGDAVLMEMNYLRDVHYPSAYQPISELDHLSQEVFEFVRVDPSYTGELRKLAIQQTGCTKSRFDTALKKLQISLNVVRSNDLNEKNDRWLPFKELYPEIVEAHS
ncbi:AlkZ-related protein [Rubellicoccus peritrichatus]|uniref:Uncharacterized protein n=1 Tax=Rubellicoccus peritrichatus TaxID=3080537 RepID=A0AAQ3QWK1_9BACT|nr:hypothetical protein [Puniceicoccus sp. CR14]WOO42798.1 hypothetical protein RZN69_06815 [Puniceicoccus sp. CR14]